MNVKERLIQFIGTLPEGQGKFETKIGVSNGYVNNIRKSISSDVLKKITDKYPELNRNWLLFGEGEMLVSTVRNVAKPFDSTEYAEYPFVGVRSRAGYLAGHADPEFIEELPTKLLPKEYEKGNYMAFEISGDSMWDGTDRSINEGDIVLGKELDRSHWKNPLYHKKYLFIFVTKHDGIICKQVVSHETTNGKITVHSFNPAYSDYSINIEDVLQIFYLKKIVERKINF